eukprot:TRINITY_DN35162_c0_g1_i1.p1 TRINITY_DN35162_c0_g1~~TRINITY_DN35162_c0_g1_i1.p1  ORF type:complete len:391 (+),score=78.39 TRINITY_DN35162_c0_g1_i1:92-1264(+)
MPSPSAGSSGQPLGSYQLSDPGSDGSYVDLLQEGSVDGQQSGSVADSLPPEFSFQEDANSSQPTPRRGQANAGPRFSSDVEVRAVEVSSQPQSARSVASEPTRWWWEEDGAVPPWEMQSKERTMAKPRPQQQAIGSLKPPSKKLASRKSARGGRHDIQLFSLWSSAGVKDEPNTIWEEPLRPVATASERRTLTDRGEKAMFLRPPTVRSALIGPLRPNTSDALPSRLKTQRHQLPKVTKHSQRLSRSDGEYRCQIHGMRLFWAEDGSETRLTYHGVGGHIVSMMVDKEAHSGVLSSDGRLLRWGDGDLWVRDDDDMDSLRASTAACSTSCGESSESSLWQGWNVKRQLNRTTPKWMLPALLAARSQLSTAPHSSRSVSSQPSTGPLYETV